MKNIGYWLFERINEEVEDEFDDLAGEESALEVIDNEDEVIISIPLNQQEFHQYLALKGQYNQGY